MTDLVSMFRCKHCAVQMFERDCAGHLQRHGLAVGAAKVLSHFERGPRTANAVPGAALKPLYYQHGKKGRPVAAAAEEEVDDLGDLN